MPSELDIQIKIKQIGFILKKQEPDGSHCDACGEVIFLNQFQALFLFRLGATEKFSLAKTVCAACADSLKSQIVNPKS